MWGEYNPIAVVLNLEPPWELLDDHQNTDRWAPLTVYLRWGPIIGIFRGFQGDA